MKNDQEYKSMNNLKYPKKIKRKVSNYSIPEKFEALFDSLKRDSIEFADFSGAGKINNNKKENL